MSAGRTGDIAEPRAWAQQLAARPDGALSLIGSALHSLTRSGPRIGDQEEIPTINLDDLQKFVDLEDIDRAIASLREEALDSRQRLAVQVFWRKRGGAED